MDEICSSWEVEWIPACSIVKILRRYNQELLVDFVVHLMKSFRSDLQSVFDNLQTEGVVRLQGTGSNQTVVLL